MRTDISLSVTPHPVGRALYFQCATAFRIFLSTSARPELRTILTLETVPPSLISNLTSGEALYASPGAVLNGPVGTEPWTRIVLVHSGGRCLDSWLKQAGVRPSKSSAAVLFSFIKTWTPRTAKSIGGARRSQSSPEKRQNRR